VLAAIFKRQCLPLNEVYRWTKPWRTQNSDAILAELNKMKILLIEDHEPLRGQVSQMLAGQGFVCEEAGTLSDALEKVALYEYDLLIVDINLPGGSGLEVIRAAKKSAPQTAIMIISARDSVTQRIEGLELGADDYISKPFDMAELLARTKSLIRRYRFDGKQQISIGSISIDTFRQEVTVNAEPLDLTRTEYKLLLFFASNIGRVLTREGMAEHVWGDHMDVADSFDFIYSHIKNLRKKLRQAGGDDPIRVVYGVGYKMMD
jgi:DNA-binding response OmpR family regulator